jgi:hypothetical protein
MTLLKTPFSTLIHSLTRSQTQTSSIVDISPKPASSSTPKLLRKVLDHQAKLGSQSLQTENQTTSHLKVEIESYLKDMVVDENHLSFFRTFQRKYPLLTPLAKRLLHVTTKLVSAECLFSQTGLIDTELINRLSYEH